LVTVIYWSILNLRLESRCSRIGNQYGSLSLITFLALVSVKATWFSKFSFLSIYNLRYLRTVNICYYTFVPCYFNECDFNITRRKFNPISWASIQLAAGWLFQYILYSIDGWCKTHISANFFNSSTTDVYLLSLTHSSFTSLKFFCHWFLLSAILLLHIQPYIFLHSRFRCSKFVWSFYLGGSSSLF